MRVAIVHDWLLGMRGGERCLQEVLRLYPGSDVFTLVLDREAIPDQIANTVRGVSPLQQWPGGLKNHRMYLPLFPFAVRALSRDLLIAHREKPYDVVVSISHCAAKNIKAPAGVPHFCYCLTPVRYIWDQFEVYFGGRAIEPVARMISPLLRNWDRRSADKVHRFVAISRFVANRIRRYYGRPSDVLYPPLDLDWLETEDSSAATEEFLCVSALVPYKNVDKIVTAFNRLSLKLKIVGTGPEEPRLRRLAGPTIEFLGRVSEDELARLYRASRAMVFAAEEDFGLTPLEMQASGRPVIALGKGGALETVRFEGNNRTGLSFPDLQIDSICGAVERFIQEEQSFKSEDCRDNARRFSRSIFCDSFSDLLGKFVDEWHGEAVAEEQAPLKRVNSRDF